MKRLGAGLLSVFSSLGLSCVLLILLALLTWLGTLEQVEYGLFEVQKKYFESFFLIHHAGPIPIPLPGANLVLCVLFANLLVGGILRLRRRVATAGILVTHFGIAFMLLAGFIKMYHSNDGHVTLFEGESANYFQSYFRWELVVLEELQDGRVREHIVPQEDFADATGAKPVRLTSSELPFELEVRHFMRNCEPMPKGPMFEVEVPVVDGVFLQPQRPMQEAEANVAGAYVGAVEESGARHEGALWGLQRYPLTVHAGGRTFGLDLRKERYPLPFTVVLDDFTKEDHPRLDMPKAFSSDVTVVERGSSRPVKISMNEPLRDRGYVLYQASWGPSTARPGDPLFSTLSVVRNPADQFPLYACIVIGLGLLFHFILKLVRYILRETARP